MKKTRENSGEKYVSEKNKDHQSKGISYLRVLKSAVAAAFGVQTKSNLEHDFEQKSIVPYLVAGTLLTVVFIFVLIGLAKLAAQ